MMVKTTERVIGMTLTIHTTMYSSTNQVPEFTEWLYHCHTELQNTSLRTYSITHDNRLIFTLHNTFTRKNHTSQHE